MSKNNYNLGSYYLNNINKMQSAFRWEGLPDTIPQKWLESQLQVNGFSFITRADDGNLYAFYGGLGGDWLTDKSVAEGGEKNAKE